MEVGLEFGESCTPVMDLLHMLLRHLYASGKARPAEKPLPVNWRSLAGIKCGVVFRRTKCFEPSHMQLLLGVHRRCL